MNQKTSYEYADGSSNLYRITEAELKYVAVTAEESSSGSYSGGKNKTVSLTSSQYNTLQSLFERAIQNKEVHIQNRIMMSSIVSSISTNDKKQCILKPGCAEIIEIESYLKNILGN